MNPILEQSPLFPEQPIQILDPKRSTEPAPQDEMLRSRDRPCGIELHEPKIVDDFLDRTRPRGAEPLPHNGEPAGLLLGEAKTGVHAANLSVQGRSKGSVILGP